MNQPEQTANTPDDDVEGHAKHATADAETAEGDDDVEGHARR